MRAKRAFTVWVVVWFMIGWLTLIYGAIRWGREPIGTAGSIYLLIVMIIQPVLCGLWWLVGYWLTYHPRPFSRVRDWINHG